MKYKLYVWTGFEPDYTEGLAFAIAGDEDEARELVALKFGWPSITWGNLTIHNLNKPVGFCVSGGG